MKNFYEKAPKINYHNPGFKNHGIQIPFRMLIIAKTGAGKTNFALNLIQIMDKTFSQIVICCKSKSEPLYEFIDQEINTDNPGSILFYENEIPPIEQFNVPKQQTLIIFDDLINEKRLEPEIAEYFIRGRKVGQGISCMYLSQIYFKIPTVIRAQANYILIKKISSTKDLQRIVSEFGIPGFEDPKVFVKYYNTHVKNMLDYILIDIDKGSVRNYIEKKDENKSKNPKK